MLDFVFAVDDPVTWHTMNLMQNRKHYSVLKMLGPKKISSIQSDRGAGVYYNTLVPVDGRVNDLSVQKRFADINCIFCKKKKRRKRRGKEHLLYYGGQCFLCFFA